MRATQLDALMDNYNRAAEEKAVAESVLKDKIKGLESLEKEKKTWERKFKLLSKLEERRDRCRVCTRSQLMQVFFGRMSGGYRWLIPPEP